MYGLVHYEEKILSMYWYVMDILQRWSTFRLIQWRQDPKQENWLHLEDDLSLSLHYTALWSTHLYQQ